MILKIVSDFGFRASDFMLFGSLGYKVPRSLLHLFDLPNQLVEILSTIHDVNLARVHDQKGSLIKVEKIVIVSLCQRLEVL